MVLTCAGMMDGQLVVCTDPQGDSSTIMFAIMASNPDSSVERVYSIFKSLIQEKFPNCIFWVLLTRSNIEYLTTAYLWITLQIPCVKNVWRLLSH